MQKLPMHCAMVFCGAYSVSWLEALPPNPVEIASAIAIAGSLAVVAGFLWRHAVLLLLSFIAGGVIFAIAANAAMSDRLSPRLEGTDRRAAVRIVDFPTGNAEGTIQFIATPVSDTSLPSRIRLSWYESDLRPRLGEVWQLTLRLRRPRGTLNEGAFDTEGWFVRERIGASGYVVDGSQDQRLLATSESNIDRARSRIDQRLTRLLPADTASAVLKALSIGTRHAIQREQWQVFAATGTSHLIAISGLHVGLAASFVFMLARAIFAYTLPTTFSPYRWSAGAALAAAAGYSAISGLAIPAQRATLMIAVATAMFFLARPPRSATILCMAALIVFIANPLSILTPGFRLSFAAVIAIVLVLQATTHPWRLRFLPLAETFVQRAIQLLKIQAALFAALFPLTALEFSQVSLAAPIVNIVLVPIFGIFVVPVTLLGLLLDGPFAVAGDLLLELSHASIRHGFSLLVRASQWPYSHIPIVSLPGLLTLVALLPSLLVLLPSGWPGRRIGLLAMCAVFAYRPPTTPKGCVDYHVLDVGQGLSVFIQTRDRNLLYDTGASYRSGGSVAESVISPFLRARGIDKVDKLVVSHADNDHAGGVDVIHESVQVAQLRVGESFETRFVAPLPCIAGDHWRWNDVDFKTLHPRRYSPWSGNNSSCVLQIEAGDSRLLLSGDIEAPVETLLNYRSVFSAVDVLVVPHHGSKTSSSDALVAATQPKVAIVSAAHKNRWGFPKADVVNRYETVGASVLNTANSGEISQRLCRFGPVWPIHERRRQNRRWWHEPPTGTR